MPLLIDQRGASFIRKPPRHIAVPGHAISGLQLVVIRAWLPVERGQPIPRVFVGIALGCFGGLLDHGCETTSSTKGRLRAIRFREGSRGSLGFPYALLSHPRNPRLRFAVRSTSWRCVVSA